MTRTAHFQTAPSTALRSIAGLTALVVTLGMVSTLGQLADGYQSEAVLASRAASAARYAATETGLTTERVQRVVVTAQRAAVRG